MKRLLAALVAVMAVAASMAVATTAGAQERDNPWFVDRYPASGLSEITEIRPNGRVAFTTPLGRVYGDAQHDFFVMTGGDLTGFCFEDPPRIHEMIGYRANGEFVMRTPAGGTTVATFVYPSSGTDFFTWAFGACEAFFTDGTPLPTAVASGYATLRINSNPSIPIWASETDQPTGFYRNRVNGTLTDAEGNLWEVATSVAFPLTGEEQGPPAFVRHDVSLTPQAAQ